MATIELVRRAAIAVDMSHSQKAVYDVLVKEPAGALGRLGTVLDLAVGHLGVPR